MLQLLLLIAPSCPLILPHGESLLFPDGQSFAPPAITIVCPDETKVFCGGSLDPDDTGTPVVTTTCATPATVTYSDAPGLLMNCPTNRFQQIMQRTWTARDACGNQTSCVQSIIILRQIWDMDILPATCPNTIDTHVTTGTILVSVSGTAAQNVAHIVPGSIGIYCDECMAGPVTPASTSLGDASTPFYMDTECGCTTAGGDGILDLKIQFSRAAMIAGLHLNSFPSGSQPRLVVTGMLDDGCTFLALDCVRVVSVPDCNGNGVPDSLDIANGTSSDLDGDGVPDTCQGTQGCSLGYWKNHVAAWTGTGYGPNDDFDTVFGVNAFTPDRTLLRALQTGGGGINNLGRQGVAALLSAAKAGVNYPLTPAEVILAVRNAVLNGTAGTVGSQLDTLNNLGCPLN